MGKKRACVQGGGPQKIMESEEKTSEHFLEKTNLHLGIGIFGIHFKVRCFVHLNLPKRQSSHEKSKPTR